MPGGDGIVDAQDLVALSDHLFEDYRLISHWLLDDTEGILTYDSFGNRPGFIIGAPNWRPDSGRVDGALLLTGSGNYLRIPLVSNLVIRPFSLFAWVKGGQAAQVVLAQDRVHNWLMADPQSGALMTELTGPNPGDTALISNTVITDDTWHHVGLVWSGTQRALYVDDIEVARDEMSQLLRTSAGLVVGADATLTPGSFWPGMLDDIRIYDRAIEP